MTHYNSPAVHRRLLFISRFALFWHGSPTSEQQSSQCSSQQAAAQSGQQHGLGGHHAQFSYKQAGFCLPRRAAM